MKIDKTYTHFAVQNGKIINGWSYKGIDPEELKEFKKDYFFEDLINMGLNPKSIKIMNKQSLLKNNIDPFNINNWPTPIQENTNKNINKMKTKKINLTELKQVIVNIIKEDFGNNEIIRDEIPEKIGQITGGENILDLLNKYSLSEVLDFISKTYNEWGEFDAASKAKEYSNDFIKTLY